LLTLTAIFAAAVISYQISNRVAAGDKSRNLNRQLTPVFLAEYHNTAQRSQLQQRFRIIADYGRFAAVAPTTAQLAAEDRSGLSPVETRINLGGNSFDPTRQPYKAGLIDSSNSDTGYFVIQLAAPANDSIIASLAADGLEVLQYIPHNGFIVYSTAAAAARSARTNPLVRWAGPYLPEYKIPGQLQNQISAALGRRLKQDEMPPLVLSGKNRAVFDVAVFKREPPAAIAEKIAESTGGKILAVIEIPANFFNVVRLEIPLDFVEKAAAISGVFSIAAWSPPSKEDERAAMIISGNYSGTATIAPPGYNPLAQFGVDGTGVTVAVEDDGVGIPGDGGFYITTANAVNGPLRGASTGASGHGHLNATIIAGDAPFSIPDADGYNYALGIAPKANILNIPLLRAGYGGTEAQSYADTVASMGPNGVKASISNNSWGNGTNANVYDSYTASFDGFVRDASSGGGIDPLTIIFSAGNSGTSGLTRPKVAKNVISVAASENLRPTLPNSGGSTGAADNLEQIPDFSSRGLAADGRIKPDVTAPGDAVTGGRSGSDPLFGNIDIYHRVSSGTSHAAPQVAGAAALFTQFWKNSHSGQNPSPSLVKAAIINSAVEMTGAGATQAMPNGSEGWGRVNLRFLLDPAAARYFVDDTDTRSILSDTGDRVVFTGRIADETKPLKITIAWSDPPGAAQPALVNDLDLVVYVGGTPYRGNVFSSGMSVTGGSADTLNNVEAIRLPPGIPGGTPVVITVTGSSINGDGILGNSDLFDQSFSLAAYNLSDSAEPFIEDSGVAITAESAVPANGVPDPGETLTVNLSLDNNGTAATGNLVATLTSTPQVTPVSSPQNFGALAAGGSPQVRPFSFRVSSLASCGNSITLVWNLTDNGYQIGTISKTYQLGTPSTGSPQIFSNSAPVVIPASGSGTSAGAPANPYPSTIVVSGLAQKAGEVKVRLNGVRHSFPADIDVLLVNPGGRAMILMSDVVGGTDFTGQTYTFSDSAASLLPSGGSPPASGTYRPTNYGSTDNFPAPAPAPPYDSPATAGTVTLTQAFTGSDGGNPNGTWSLFVADDSSSDIGAFDGGWDLVITPLNYLCSLSPTAAGATLSGRVVDESGRGVSRASVSISDGGEFAGFASTNSFGYFRIENVPVGRLYIVTAKSRGLFFDTFAFEFNDSATQILLTGRQQ